MRYPYWRRALPLQWAVIKFDVNLDCNYLTMLRDCDNIQGFNADHSEAVVCCLFIMCC